MSIQDKYMINKDFFGRHWRKNRGELSPFSKMPYVQDSWTNRYCIIMAAIDNEGIDFVLENFLKLSKNLRKKYRNIMILALSNKQGIICR